MFKGLLAATLVVAGLALPASAQNCAKRDLVVERLKAQFSEQLTAGGLQGTSPVETLLEVWASPETGTFTILMTNPNGLSCIVAAGTDFFSGPVKAGAVAQQG